jgi:copper chaperone
MANIILKIKGMSCQHCVMSVKKSLDGLQGIQSCEITVGSAKVSFDESITSKETIVSAVTNDGYKVT